MSFRRTLTVAMLAALPLSVVSPAPGRPAADLQARLQSVLNGAVAADPAIPGVLLAVSDLPAHFSWSGAAGRIRLDRPQALSPDQPFRIASITKVFVAATVFCLIEKGRIDLFNGIAPLLSSATVTMLTRGGYDPYRITIQELLAHTSGLYDYASDSRFVEQVQQSPQRRWTRAEQIAIAMSNGRPVGKPGERYAYSDTGYLILGEIIERATGQALPAAMRKVLNMDGLGLKSTYFESLEAPPRGILAPAHQYLGAVDTTRFDPSFDLFGGGGLVSTTADLNRFFRALFEGRVFERRATLAAALMTVNAEHDPAEHLHANLMTTWPFGKRVCWGHLGFWGSEAIYCPTAGLVVSFTVNQARTRNPDSLAKLANAIAEQLALSTAAR